MSRTRRNRIDGPFGRLAVRLTFILVAAGLFPLSVYGALSVSAARNTASASLERSLLEAAIRAAGQLDLYVGNCLRNLAAISENFANVQLLPWQANRVLSNYMLEFREFRLLSFVDPKGALAAGTPLANESKTPTSEASLRAALEGRRFIGEPYLTDELTPAMDVCIPVSRLKEPYGAVLARIDLVDLWRLVGSIRIGRTGFACVITPSGKLIAHGNPNSLSLVLQGAREDATPLAAEVSRTTRPLQSSYVDRNGSPVIAAGAVIPSVGWVVVIEQAKAEAFKLSSRMTRYLLLEILATLTAAGLLGALLGRMEILRPIQTLIAGTRRIAEGNLEARVEPCGGEEFHTLGQAFNRMGEELLRMQKKIRRQERVAAMGSIASGLVHDLKQPFQNIVNMARLLLKAPDDPQTRALAASAIEREKANADRFFNNLRDLADPPSLVIVPMDLAPAVDGVLDLYRKQAADHGVEIQTHHGSPQARVRADQFALERILKNLICNALDVMQNGGKMLIRSEADPSDEAYAVIRIQDSGPGIPADRLHTLFDHFVTNKRQGLGLGLVVSRRLAEEMRGRLEVRSEPGQGAEFLLRLPFATNF